MRNEEWGIKYLSADIWQKLPKFVTRKAEKHYGVDIIVDKVEFAGSKSEKKSDEAKDEWSGTPVDDDDMPF